MMNQFTVLIYFTIYRIFIKNAMKPIKIETNTIGFLFFYFIGPRIHILAAFYLKFYIYKLL